jgi:hypothetical protein
MGVFGSLLARGVVIVGAAGSISALVAEPACANTYTVTTTANGGAGSLRKAIQDANAHSGADTIDFNIPGTGPFVIKPVTALPVITGKVTLDATTQPGWIAAPLVELDGSSIIGVRGIDITASGVTVRGLAVHSLASSVGICVRGANARIEQCWVGLDAAGTVARANLEGIVIDATGARVSSCVASGNTNGIGGKGGAKSAIVEDNIVGLDPTGTNVIANRDGIVMGLGATAAIVRGNVVSGNWQHGVLITDAGSSRHSILDNWIGTGADHVTRIGNGAHGVHVINGDSSLIQGNVITANGSAGVRVELNNGSSTQARKNRVTLNSIFGNGGLGIDIGNGGTDSNDALDADTGANELQNTPLLTRAVTDPRGLHLWGNSIHCLPRRTRSRCSAARPPISRARSSSARSR